MGKTYWGRMWRRQLLDSLWWNPWRVLKGGKKKKKWEKKRAGTIEKKGGKIIGLSRLPKVITTPEKEKGEEERGKDFVKKRRGGEGGSLFVNAFSACLKVDAQHSVDRGRKKKRKGETEGELGERKKERGQPLNP